MRRLFPKVSDRNVIAKHSSGVSTLIYIHRGYSWYVPLALANGRRFGGHVCYLGDAFGCRIARKFGATTARIGDFAATSRAFEPFYRHHSTLGVEFERQCISRWFILRDYMKAVDLKSAIYLDTDILATTPLDPFQEQTRHYGMTFTGYSAHCCFINDVAVLDMFCDFVTEVYSDLVWDVRLRDWERHMLSAAGAGGVSDMTLFQWFHQRHPELLGSYDDIFQDSPIDLSLAETAGWKATEQGFKYLLWDDGGPAAIREDGTPVKLAALHHQGTAKLLMRANARKLGDLTSRRELALRFWDLTFRAARKIRANSTKSR